MCLAPPWHVPAWKYYKGTWSLGGLPTPRTFCAALAAGHRDEGTAAVSHAQGVAVKAVVKAPPPCGLVQGVLAKDQQGHDRGVSAMIDLQLPAGG